MKKPFATPLPNYTIIPESNKNILLGKSSGSAEKNFFEVFNISEKEKNEFDDMFKQIDKKFKIK